mgnify:CR=1 FL=1
MKTIHQIKAVSRQKNKPSNVSKVEWANAINWTIEAWKCHLKGQTWIHDFVIKCPEQYFLMLNEKGQFIFPLKSVRFEDNDANTAWAVRLRHGIQEMRIKGEWNESMEWTKVLRQLIRYQGVSPNQDALKKRQAIKGYKLIRIKPAA